MSEQFYVARYSQKTYFHYVICLSFKFLLKLLDIQIFAVCKLVHAVTQHFSLKFGFTCGSLDKKLPKYTIISNILLQYFNIYCLAAVCLCGPQVCGDCDFIHIHTYVSLIIKLNCGFIHKKIPFLFLLYTLKQN